MTSDHYPPPPAPPAGTPLTAPRPLAGSGGRIVVFDTLGGPAPTGGSQGRLLIGAPFGAPIETPIGSPGGPPSGPGDQPESAPAAEGSLSAGLLASLGPKLVLRLDRPLAPPLETAAAPEAAPGGPPAAGAPAGAAGTPGSPGTAAPPTELPRLARWLPDPVPADPIDNPRPLPSLDLFLDRLDGWLMAVAEALPGGGAFGPSVWTEPPDGPPPEGVSFYWAVPPGFPDLVAGLAASLPASETTLVVSGLDAPLAALAGKVPGALLLAARPTGDDRLDRASMGAAVESLADERAKAALAARRLHETHREAESLVASRIELLAKEASLERSRGLLTDEARSKRLEWRDREIELAAAGRRWTEDGQIPKGLAGLIGRKAREDKAARAQHALDRAEAAMRQARLDMESLLGELRTVEAQLAEARAMTAGLPPAEDLQRDLAALRAEGRVLAAEAANLAGEVTEAQFRQQAAGRAGAICARPGWTAEGLIDPGTLFDNVVICAPPLHDHRSRQELAREARRAARRFVVVADFTGWAWTRPAPAAADGAPAWRSYLAADPAAPAATETGPAGRAGRAAISNPPELSPGLSPAFPPGLSPTLSPDLPPDLSPALPTAVLGPVFDLADPAGGLWLVPDRNRARLFGVDSSGALAKLDLDRIQAKGPGLRAFDGSGPASPGSALACVRLAIEAVRSGGPGAGPAQGPLRTTDPQEPKPCSSLSDLALPRPLVCVITPSPVQTALVQAAICDLGAAGTVHAGQIQDFALWPRADLVIVDTALVPPQAAHPWSAPESGRPVLLRALALAGGALVVAACSSAMARLPKGSLLARFWDSLPASAWPGWNPPQKTTFLDAVDKARDRIWCVFPPFGPDWFPAVGPRLLAAARRRVKVTVLASVPDGPGLAYSDAAIRELRLHGANVILSRGLDNLIAVIDSRELVMGGLAGGPNRTLRPQLACLPLPRTAPLVLDLLGTATINEKLGPGGWRNCPMCGWPYVLVNDGRPRGFGDRQSMKLGCLNSACPNRKRPRPLDERWPFQAPPVCPEDGLTRYRIRRDGRRRVWFCPRHPESCPTHRLIPGDCPGLAREAGGDDFPDLPWADD